MKFFAIAGLIATTAAAELCCSVCSGDGVEKTYSIDTKAGHCGESCIPANKFWLYKIFEAGLTVAENGNESFPCKEHGFTDYWQTETHGIPHILSVAVDFYNVPGVVPTTTVDKTIKNMIKKEIDS